MPQRSIFGFQSRPKPNRLRAGSASAFGETAVSFGGHTDGQSPSQEDAVALLRQQVALLERRNALLEAQIATLAALLTPRFRVS